MRKTALFYLITFLSPATQASALYFYEIGTEDAALAGAGQLHVLRTRPQS